MTSGPLDAILLAMDKSAVRDGLELAFLSNLEYFRELTRRSGGTVLDEDGVTCFASPHPFPFLVSGAFRTDPSRPPADVLEHLGRFRASRGRSLPLSALGGRDDDLIEAALEVGWTLGESPDPLQVLDRQRLEGHDVAGIAFRPVVDAAGVADLTAVCQGAHAAYGFPDDLFATLFARPEAVIAAHIRAVVGYDGDAPVATATLFLTHGVAYVGWIAVLDDHQRRGLGAAATAVVTNDGFDRGAQCTVLVASPMGAPLYRKLGFVDVAEIVGLEPPESA
ncbi:MAG: GNAT family N-acetyltransferase [Mycobacteriales bacterium]